jgi:type II secretory pathway predicted ATPase ExeA
MYNDFFGFTERPFTSMPRVEQYYPANAIEAARNTLGRCIERGEGAAVVVGPSGTGKSLLLLVLAEQFKQTYQVAMLSSGRLTTQRALLQTILHQIGRPFRGMDEGELRLNLNDYLTCSQDCPKGILLLVDEAHALPMRLLDVLRALTNLARNGQPCVRLILAGNRVLEERLASPKLESLAQRLVARCFLEALSHEETLDFVRSGVQCACGDAEKIFPEEACHRIHRLTDGVPRLINQLCDRALLSAFARGQSVLEPALIEEAWADLQQLPVASKQASPEDNGEKNVIEFGRLDDLFEDNANAGICQFSFDENVTVPLSGVTVVASPVQGIGEEPSPPKNDLSEDTDDMDTTFNDPFQEQFDHEEVVTDRYVPPSPLLDEIKPPLVETVGYGFHYREQEAVGGEDGPRTVPLGSWETQDAESDDDMIVVEDEYDDGQSPPSHSVCVVSHQDYKQLFTRLRRGCMDGAKKAS